MPPGSENSAHPITYANFLEIMKIRSAEMISLCRLALDNPANNPFSSRAFTQALRFEAAQVEEIMDIYGAKKNTEWSALRDFVATIISFADAASKLLFISEMIPRYRLMTIGGDFASETLRQSEIIRAILTRAAEGVIAEAKRLGLPQESARSTQDFFAKQERFTGTLPANKESEHIPYSTQNIVQLATAFLLEAGQSQLKKLTAKLKRSEYASYIPDTFSEKILRIAEEEFHNLQSMYDTYISNTEIERQDEKLPVIRDHISIIYTLLDLATVFAHYYERHIMRAQDTQTSPVRPDELLTILMEYAIAYAGLFMRSTQQICQAVLKRFTEQNVLKVNAPVYRGFHVRPSTLIAKIVMHYGSEVSLVTADGSLYNASSPLELFRVNEKINAEKRRILLQHLATLEEVKNPPGDPQAMQAAFRHIFLQLLSAQKIVVYGSSIPFSELTPVDGEDFSEYIKRVLAFLIAQGLIDIRIETFVQFVGDKHVLDDIAILAKNGYAEDSYGNDIVLPKELSYLHR